MMTSISKIPADFYIQNQNYIENYPLKADVANNSLICFDYTRKPLGDLKYILCKVHTNID